MPPYDFRLRSRDGLVLMSADLDCADDQEARRDAAKFLDSHERAEIAEVSRDKRRLFTISKS